MDRIQKVKEYFKNKYENICKVSLRKTETGWEFVINRSYEDIRDTGAILKKFNINSFIIHKFCGPNMLWIRIPFDKNPLDQELFYTDKLPYDDLSLTAKIESEYCYSELHFRLSNLSEKIECLSTLNNSGMFKEESSYRILCKSSSYKEVNEMRKLSGLPRMKKEKYLKYLCE